MTDEIIKKNWKTMSDDERNELIKLLKEFQQPREKEVK